MNQLRKTLVVLLLAVMATTLAAAQSVKSLPKDPLAARKPSSYPQSKTDEQVAKVRDGFTAYFSGDASKMRALLDEDVKLHIAGNSQLAGVYEGPDAVLAFGLKIFQLTDNTFAGKPLYFTGNERFVHILIDDTASRNGKTLKWFEGIIQEFNSEGKITHVYACFSNQAEWDAFIDGKL